MVLLQFNFFFTDAYLSVKYTLVGVFNHLSCLVFELHQESFHPQHKEIYQNKFSDFIISSDFAEPFSIVHQHPQIYPGSE